jgi:hypothetical protein
VSVDGLQLLMLALQLVIIPGVWRLHSMLWQFNERITRIESRLGIPQEKHQ